MRGQRIHIALAVVVAIAGVAAVIAVDRLTYHRPAAVSTPPGDVAPPGWTVDCRPAAIGPVCHTYPPGDDRWQPKAPIPPQRPLPTPWPGGEDAR